MRQPKSLATFAARSVIKLLIPRIDAGGKIDLPDHLKAIILANMSIGAQVRWLGFGLKISANGATCTVSHATMARPGGARWDGHMTIQLVRHKDSRSQLPTKNTVDDLGDNMEVRVYRWRPEYKSIPVWHLGAIAETLLYSHSVRVGTWYRGARSYDIYKLTVNKKHIYKVMRSKDDLLHGLQEYEDPNEEYVRENRRGGMLHGSRVRRDTQTRRYITIENYHYGRRCDRRREWGYDLLQLDQNCGSGFHVAFHDGIVRMIMWRQADSDPVEIWEKFYDAFTSYAICVPTPEQLVQIPREYWPLMGFEN